MALAVGTNLDHYELRSKLDEGGMGEGYLAQVISSIRERGIT